MGARELRDFGSGKVPSAHWHSSAPQVSPLPPSGHRGASGYDIHPLTVIQSNMTEMSHNRQNEPNGSLMQRLEIIGKLQTLTCCDRKDVSRMRRCLRQQLLLRYTIVPHGAFYFVPLF